jgi:FK506-binding nuclear protein
MASRIHTLMALSLALAAHGCARPDVTVEETPITVVSESIGRGIVAKDGDLVTISYEVKLESGAVALADESHSFEIGADAVIRGIDETVRGMRLGGRRVVLCPPQKHWGRAGYGNGVIPPNETLTMDIMLKAIK